jgi:hypothetical protein
MATEENVGAITALSDSTTIDGGVHGSYRTGAYFVRRQITPPLFPPATVGPCLVETFNPNDPGGPERDMSAGALKITGGTSPLDMAPGTKDNYAGLRSSTSALWNGGEMLVATAAGSASGVPAFSASLTAPSKLTVTAPALPQTASGSLTVARDAPLTVSWTGASSGSVIVYLDIATPNKAYTVTCTYKPSDATGQVPAAALGMLPAGAGSYDLYVIERASPSVPAWKINFAASSSMGDPAGHAATGNVTFP